MRHTRHVSRVLSVLLLCVSLCHVVASGTIDYSRAECSPVLGDIDADTFYYDESREAFTATPGGEIWLMPYYFDLFHAALPTIATTLQTTLDDNSGLNIDLPLDTHYAQSGYVSMRLGIFTQTYGGDDNVVPAIPAQFQLLAQTEEVVLYNPTKGIYNATLVNASGSPTPFTLVAGSQYFLGEWFNTSVWQDYRLDYRGYASNSSLYPYSHDGFPTGTIYMNVSETGPGSNIAGGYTWQPIVLSNCIVDDVVTPPAGSIVGDPQFIGMLGQSYQVHGIDGAYYNLITSNSTQVNARFVYIQSGQCPPLPSAANCWSHPGSYLGGVGVMEVVDGHTQQLAMVAGAASEGYANVTLNGETLNVGSSVTLGTLSVHYESSHHVLVDTAQFHFVFDSSDRFINQQVSSRVRLSHLTSHGLLGQTHHMRYYNTALKYIESVVDDYVLGEDSLWGIDFPYNQFPVIAP